MNKQHSDGVRRTRRRTESRNTRRFTENDAKKYQIGKRLAMMEYMDSGTRNSPSFMTDLHSKWTRGQRTRIDDQRKDHIDPKRPRKSTTPNNYRYTTCIHMMGEILRAQ